MIVADSNKFETDDDDDDDDDYDDDDDNTMHFKETCINFKGMYKVITILVPYKGSLYTSFLITQQNSYSISPLTRHSDYTVTGHWRHSHRCKRLAALWLLSSSTVLSSSVASPICKEGQSERTFPIFPLFPDIFPLFPAFSWFSSSFPRFFYNFFRSQEGTLPLWPPRDYATGVVTVLPALVNSDNTVTVQSLCSHPIKVEEQGYYHVIVVIEYSGVQHPWYQCCLFRTEYQSILYHETYHVIVCKITW